MMRTSQRIQSKRVETAPREEFREIRLMTTNSKKSEEPSSFDIYDRVDNQIEALVALLAAERLLSSAASEVEFE
jgi:hypothetical protein